MSSLGRRPVLGLAVAACAATAAHGQTVDQQRARVELLAARLASLEARLDSLERLQDTLEVDGVRFVVQPGQRAQAEEAARRGLAELERRLGTADRRLFDGRVFRLHAGTPGPDWVRRAADAIVREAGHEHLHQMGGRDLQPWGAWWDPEERDLQGAYLDLVTSPSIVAARCFAGGIDACRQLLGIEPVADPWTELFDASGRRIWIARRLGWLRSTTWPGYATRAGLFRRCVDEGEDAACLDLVREFPTPAFRGSARTSRSVVFVARSVGGDGTYTRLVADTTAPLGDRLAAAARMPLDSLLATWQQAVRAAEPVPTRVGRVTGWTSFLAVVLAGVLALRSTRWRLA
jgi:hypothetical protein